MNLERAVGSQLDKQRPCVVVSNDRVNEYASLTDRGVITVVPMTSNVENVRPFQVFMAAAATGLSRDSKASSEQIIAVAVERVGPHAGRVPRALMAELDDALRLHLAL
ncbi:MAG: type II toxin-antitoxin system PemK/MazF family toxin [Candidatus Dormibacteraceae bacterium]